jgi:hypothetical protein
MTAVDENKMLQFRFDKWTKYRGNKNCYFEVPSRATFEKAKKTREEWHLLEDTEGSRDHHVTW